MKLDYRQFSLSRQILIIAISLSIVLILFLSTFLASQILIGKNALKETGNKNRSFAVVEKIDRNFYERFGDVQAYAFNRLAIQAIDSARATPSVQKFINTMVSYYVLYDLMMIVDSNGKVVAANTADKNGVPLRTESIIGQDFGNEEWFRICMSAQGPAGGAWYSDFMESAIVSTIYGTKGRGMAFAAPIKNDYGQVIGVWYNFASWLDVTQGIRSETEQLLRQEYADAFVLITDKFGKVIDSQDESMIGTATISTDQLRDPAYTFTFNGKKIRLADYALGIGQGQGAYTYKGNGWRALTFVPRDSFSFSLFWTDLRTFSIVIIVILLAGILAFYLFARNISKRIKSLQDAINSLSIGELADIRETNWNDEVGQMTNSLRDLTTGLKATSTFANEIGSGNLDVSFNPLSEKDVLGHSLVTMRSNLIKIRSEDEKRKWIAQGLADFGDLLRKGTASTQHLCDQVLIYICRYLDANQAAIFVEEEREGDSWIEMIACYAWNRKKHLSVRIEKGEGMIGQVWQEAEMVYMTHLPDNFVKITSGLGEANPTNIILLPLKNDQEMLGVLEIASMKKLENFEIEFLQRISEGLASSIATVKINDRTKKLLEQTQIQAESLRSQEEEMRQNLEEMKATQEEFVRREREYEVEIAHLKSGKAA